MADNMKEKYESLSLAVLRDVAKSRGIKGTSTMRKEAVIQVMLAEDEKERAAESVKAQAADSGRTVADIPPYVDILADLAAHIHERLHDNSAVIADIP